MQGRNPLIDKVFGGCYVCSWRLGMRHGRINSGEQSHFQTESEEQLYFKYVSTDREFKNSFVKFHAANFVI